LNDLAGLTAVVTGASRGIGAEISTALGARGVRVAVVARTRSAIDDVALRAGNDSFGVECDVTSPASSEAAIETIRQKLGAGPDIVVANAGVFMIRTIEDTTAAELQSVVATNLTGSFAFIRGFLKDMRARGSGHVITIGSIADRHIFPGNAAYSATKYAARAIHEVLRAETRGTGIRATLISPASVDTDIWDPIQYLDSPDRPDRSAMLPPSAVSDAVLFTITQPPDVNIDELRLSRS
jgi:NADP-dependent 3-hydroxy acid dehydrogenase YdfG